MRLGPIQKAKGMSSKTFIDKYMKPRHSIILEDFVNSESPAFKKWNYTYFKENLVITKNFDTMMRHLFKEKWFRYKIKIAKSRGTRAVRKQRSFQI